MVLALPLSTLSLRVSAIQTLHTPDLSAAQLSALRDLADDAADDRPRKAGQGPDALRSTLAALGNALLTGDDSNLDKLQDQVDEMLEGDDVDPQDELELNDTARKGAAKAMRLLTVAQTTALIGEIAEDIDEPLGELLDTMAESRTASNEGFESLCDETANDLALALGGLDAKKDTVVASEVVALLKKCRALSTQDFAAQRSELERAAKDLVGDVQFLQVLRHHLQRNLAELLANPQLKGAVNAWIAAAPVRAAAASSDDADDE